MVVVRGQDAIETPIALGRIIYGNVDQTEPNNAFSAEVIPCVWSVAFLFPLSSHHPDRLLPVIGELPFTLHMVIDSILRRSSLSWAAISRHLAPLTVTVDC